MADGKHRIETAALPKQRKRHDLNDDERDEVFFRARQPAFERQCRRVAGDGSRCLGAKASPAIADMCPRHFKSPRQIVVKPPRRAPTQSANRIDDIRVAYTPLNCRERLNLRTAKQKCVSRLPQGENILIEDGGDFGIKVHLTKMLQSIVLAI